MAHDGILNLVLRLSALLCKAVPVQCFWQLPLWYFQTPVPLEACSGRDSEGKKSDSSQMESSVYTVKSQHWAPGAAADGLGEPGERVGGPRSLLCRPTRVGSTPSSFGNATAWRHTFEMRQGPLRDRAIHAGMKRIPSILVRVV